MVPVLLFGMTMAIVYRQRLALLLAGMVAIIVVAGGRPRPAGVLAADGRDDRRRAQPGTASAAAAS